MGFLKYVVAAAGALSATIAVDRDCHTIIVARLSDKPLAGQLRTNAPEIVSMSIRSESGALTDLAKRATLGDIAAYAQIYGGPVREIYANARSESFARAASDIEAAAGYTAIPTGGKYLALFAIRLTADGLSIPVRSTDKFSVYIENMFDGATYEFLALEGHQTGSNYLYYDQYTIQQDEHEKDIDVDNIIGLVMPATNKFKRVLLTYGTGKTSKYDIRELKHMAADKNLIEQQLISYTRSANDADQLTSTVSHGPLTSDVVVLPLTMVTNVEVDTDGSPLNFLMVRNKSLLVQS